MIPYLKSIEFWVGVIIFALLVKFVGIGNLANYIQVTQIFAWSYVIYRLHRHHKLIREIFNDDGGDGGA